MSTWYRLFTAVLTAGLIASCGSDDSDDTGRVVDDEPVTLNRISLNFIGRYAAPPPLFDQGKAQAVAFHPGTEQAFVVNGSSGSVDVLDMSDLGNPTKTQSLDTDDALEGSTVTSVAVYEDWIALASKAPESTDQGVVAIFHAEDLTLLAQFEVGALPSRLVFAPNGQHLLIANKGEPSADYQLDPEGSISVADLSDLTEVVVRTADFQSFNGEGSALTDDGVRIFGPDASVAQDLEPDHIVVSDDGGTAFVSLPVNNAFARIDIETATVTDILPFGLKNHCGESFFFGGGTGLDVSDSDGEINIRSWCGLKGLYQPGAVAAYEVGGQTYIVGANGGEVRSWVKDEEAYWQGDSTQGFVESVPVRDLIHPDGFSSAQNIPPQLETMATGALLNPARFSECDVRVGQTDTCRNDNNLGRLNVSWTHGYRASDSGEPVMFNSEGEEDTDGEWLMYDELHVFGARDFSIWSAEGELIWDARDRFEQHLASEDCMLGTERDIPCSDFFNSDNSTGNDFDGRSNDKGPEPGSLALGQIGEKSFAFIGLRSMGGVMVYDITDPNTPVFNDYYNTRDLWEAVPEAAGDIAGDWGPEDIAFVPAEQSPNGEPLLIIAHQVSGTTAIYQIEMTTES